MKFNYLRKSCPYSLIKSNKDAEDNWGGDVYSTTDGNGIMYDRNNTRDPYTYTDANNNTTNLDIFNFMFIAKKE